MACHLPGSALLVAVGVVVWWKAHDLLVWLGIASAITASCCAAALCTSMIYYSARFVRRRQAARGACLNCALRCQQAQVPDKEPQRALDLVS